MKKEQKGLIIISIISLIFMIIGIILVSSVSIKLLIGIFFMMFANNLSLSLK